ncbi:hypothetical protein [Tellurirhabdus bombi]|uniref:hypothetical protein n=1 Tax=Tellurirhabdus bombi TaxID=2907205 RepID=UPI001F2B5AB3|nr:hypothetical protein [Tellurirhabdus bombi]
MHSSKNYSQTAIKKYESVLASLRTDLTGKWAQINQQGFAMAHCVSSRLLPALVQIGALEVQGVPRKRQFRATNRLVSVRAEDVLKACRDMTSGKVFVEGKVQPEATQSPSIPFGGTITASDPSTDQDIVTANLDQDPEIVGLSFLSEQPVIERLTIDDVTIQISATGKPRRDIGPYLDLMVREFKAKLGQ